MLWTLRLFELLKNEEEASDALSSELYLLASSIKHVRGEVISSLSLSLSLRTGQIFPVHSYSWGVACQLTANLVPKSERVYIFRTAEM